jgi:hypothetical protein
MAQERIRETSRGLPVAFLLILSLIFTVGAMSSLLLARRRINKLTENEEVVDHASLQRARLLYEHSISAMLIATCVTVIIVAILLFQGGTIDPRLTPFEIDRLFE